MCINNIIIIDIIHICPRISFASAVGGVPGSAAVAAVAGPGVRRGTKWGLKPKETIGNHRKMMI